MKKYTDQEFLYRQTPVNYDGIAKFTSIKGNTIVWNQLVDTNTTSVTLTSGHKFITKVGGTYSLVNGTGQSISVTGGTDEVFDLSLMFGTGNEPTTVEEFTSLFPLSYYSYNQGSLLSFMGNGIKTVGFNQWDEVWEHGSLGNNGENTGSSSSPEIRSVNYIPILLNTQYYMKTPDVAIVHYYGFGKLNEYKGNQYIDRSQILNIPSGTAFIRFRTRGTYSDYKNDICLNINDPSRNGQYEPYTENTLSIPLDEFPNGMDGVNDVRDEKNETGYAKRIGRVDLGTLTYTKGGADNKCFATTGLQGLIKPAAWTGGKVNAMCIAFTSDEGNKVYRHVEDKTMGTDGSGLMYFYDSAYESLTVEQFKSAMSNVYLYYELATPLENYGVVDLGTLNWVVSNGVTPLRFEATMPSNYKKPATSAEQNRLICSRYVPRSSVTASNNETGITNYQGLNVIFVRDLTYADVASFKQSLQGVYLLYEKENPQGFTTEMKYSSYAGGTEQILPENSSIPTTAPIVADIEYYTQTEGETPYRKFWLVNGNGERWDLTEKELKSFLENPQGLGFQKTIDVTRYGERAYKNTESYNFPQVTGDVLFYDSANSTRYEKYNEFVRFLMEQPITLHYMIPVSYNSLIADTYSLECEVMSLTKTESKTDHILTSNIQMNGLGFYEGDEIEINGTANTLTINNKGDFPVGFEIELNGDFKNPYFTLEQNGELYGEAKFDDNANNFSSVFVNSKDGEQNVVLKQNNSIMPNPLAYQDLSISNGSIYVTFVKLAKGESTLTIGGDSYTISGYTIRYTPIYRSV